MSLNRFELQQGLMALTHLKTAAMPERLMQELEEELTRRVLSFENTTELLTPLPGGSLLHMACETLNATTQIELLERIAQTPLDETDVARLNNIVLNLKTMPKGSDKTKTLIAWLKARHTQWQRLGFVPDKKHSDFDQHPKGIGNLLQALNDENDQIAVWTLLEQTGLDFLVTSKIEKNILFFLHDMGLNSIPTDAWWPNLGALKTRVLNAWVNGQRQHNVKAFGITRNQMLAVWKEIPVLREPLEAAFSSWKHLPQNGHERVHLQRRLQAFTIPAFGIGAEKIEFFSIQNTSRKDMKLEKSILKRLQAPGMAKILQPIGKQTCLPGTHLRLGWNNARIVRLTDGPTPLPDDTFWTPILTKALESLSDTEKDVVEKILTHGFNITLPFTPSVMNAIAERMPTTPG